VSRLSDQVEAKIARANRAFRVSNRIIAAARDDLESHGAWLDRHRASWAEEVKRHRRLLQRKLAARALLRFVVGLVFALPFAIAKFAVARSLQAKSKDSLAREAQQGQSADPPLTRHDALQHRIQALGKEQRAASASPAPAAPQQQARRRQFSLGLDRFRARVLALLPNLLKRKGPVPALGSAALLVIALGAVREMISTAPADAPGPELRESFVLPPKATKTTITVAKAPRTERLALVSGITLVANPPPSPDGRRAPAASCAGSQSSCHAGGRRTFHADTHGKAKAQTQGSFAAAGANSLVAPMVLDQAQVTSSQSAAYPALR
jgi:hypothetical protein